MIAHPVSLKAHMHISPMVEAGGPYIGRPIIDGPKILSLWETCR